MKESGIVQAIGVYLSILKNQRRLDFIRNNTGAVPIMTKGRKTRFVRFGTKGSADFIVFFPKGRAVFIEAKSDTGKQSFDQIAFEGLIKELGFEYYLIRNFDEAKVIIDKGV